MNKKNILYPVCAESFKKWYLSNDKYIPLRHNLQYDGSSFFNISMSLLRTFN